MAVSTGKRNAKMVLDYGKGYFKYTVSALNPDAGPEDIYAFHEAVCALQGNMPAEVFFQTESELINE